MYCSYTKNITIKKKSVRNNESDSAADDMLGFRSKFLTYPMTFKFQPIKMSYDVGKIGNVCNE